MKLLTVDDIKKAEEKLDNQSESPVSLLNVFSDTEIMMLYNPYVYSDEEAELLKKQIDAISIKNNLSQFTAADTSYFFQRGGGGEAFGVYVPDIQNTINTTITLLVTGTALGFTAEFGKDIYLWLKKYAKNKFNKANIKVQFEKSKKNLTYVFFYYFDIETFETAWKKMQEIEKNESTETKSYQEYGKVIFDSKSMEWKEME